MENKMKAFEQAQKAWLGILKQEKQTEAQEAAATLREDEAKFAKIELNIIEVFETMFTMSVKQASASETAGELAWIDHLEKTYKAFFVKIPSSWRAALIQCERFEKNEDAHIERLKIAQAEWIEAAFTKAVEQFRAAL